MIGKHEQLEEEFAKLQVLYRQTLDKLISSESLIKTFKEKLQVTVETLKDTTETLKVSEQEKVKMRSAVDEQKVKVQGFKEELKEMVTAKKKAELEMKQVAQKVKDEVMADFKVVIRGLETDKYELQKQLEKANAEIKELRATSTKLRDELWDAITKWHMLEKDLEKQFKSKDTRADDMLQCREEILELKEQIVDLNRKMKQHGNELKEARELQEAAELDTDKFEQTNSQLKTEIEELKEKVQPLVAQIKALQRELDEALANY